MKKTIVCTLLLLLLLGLTDTFAAGKKEEQKFVIKMASPSQPADSCVKAFFHFEEIVEKESKGRIDAQVMHSGQLGSARDYIEGLQMGSIQMAEITTSVLTALESKFMVMDLPYISKNVDHLRKVLDSGVGDMLAKALEEKVGLKILGYMIRTPRSVYSSKGPIRTADDFVGLKIRVMQSPVMIRTFELLGAKPIPIAATERYMALQTKVVDAAENSPPLIITEKEYEVTKFVSLTEHFITPNAIVMDGKFYKKLPEDLQKIVQRAAKEAEKFATDEDKRQLADAIKVLEEKGMKVNTIPDKSSFIEKVKPLYAEYEGKIGKDLIETFLKVN
jgi:tripartite ATP-independent transporter DctP family solute receptor